MLSGPDVLSDVEAKSRDKKGKGPLSRRPALDGLRGLLVLAIVAFHLRFPHMNQGYAGADGLFVLSSFLTASFLVRNLNSGSFSYSDFYGRLAQRVLPIFLFVLVLTVVAYRFIATDQVVWSLHHETLAATTFTENLYLIITDARLASFQNNPVAHYWMPAVGAQFYLLFPYLFSLLLRWSRKNSVWVASLLTVGQVISMYQYFIDWRSGSQEFAYYTLHYRIYPMMIASSDLAVWLYYHYDRPATMAWREPVGTMLSTIGTIGLIAVVTAIFPGAPTNVALMSSLYTLILITGMELNPQSWIAKLLGLNFFQRICKCSWSLYLVHYPVIVLAHYLGMDVKEEGRFNMEVEVVGAIIITTWLTHTFIELPVKRLSFPPKQVLIAAGIAILVTFCVIFTLTSMSLDPNNQPEVEKQAPAGTPEHAAPLDAPQEHVEEPVPPSPSPSRSPPAPIETETSYFLVGDSFATEWAQSVPIISILMKLELNLLAEPECPWFPSVNDGCDPDEYWIPVMDTPAPRVIFLVSSQIYREDLARSHAGRVIKRGDSAWAASVEISIRRTLEPLLKNEQEENTIVVLKAHSPRPPALSRCLESESPMECKDFSLVGWNEIDEYKRAYEELDRIYQRMEQEYAPKFAYLEMDDLIAPYGTINAMDGPFLLFDDEFHLNPQWCTAHSFEFARKLQPFMGKK